MPTVVPPEARRARWGVIMLFWLNGVAWSSILPRYPEIKHLLGLSDTFWGIAVGLGPLGGLVAGLATARLMRRFNSAIVAVVSLFLGILMLNVIGNATVPWLFAAALFTMSCFDALTDIAMNAHGLRVQKLFGRSILNSFHGWWSIGAVCGGIFGGLGAQLHVPVGIQCLVATIIFGAMALAAKLLLLKGKDNDVTVAPDPAAGRPGRASGAVWLRLLALGLMGAAAGLIEDTGATWGAIYMDRSFTVAPFVAGLAFVALQGAQMVGRFTGDALVDRVGPRGALVQGAALATVGMGIALAAPTSWTTLLGFACAGWGVATVIPSAMHAADILPGMKPGSGLTFVTWLLRLGFLSGPPLVGLLADHVSLRWALLTVPACALLIFALSPALRPLPEAGPRR